MGTFAFSWHAIEMRRLWPAATWCGGRERLVAFVSSRHGPMCDFGGMWKRNKTCIGEPIN